MAERKATAIVDESDLASGMKHLREVADEKGVPHRDEPAQEKNILSSLEELYEKFDGDLRAIFDSLNESPRKALKHPPVDAKQFARKYYEGAYQDVVLPGGK